jgi:hypothetical protein
MDLDPGVDLVCCFALLLAGGEIAEAMSLADFIAKGGS